MNCEEAADCVTWVTVLVGTGVSTELIRCFHVPGYLFCLGAGKRNGRRDLGVVNTRQCEMVSAC